MPRTTATAVKAVMRDGQEGSDYDGVTTLDPFIDTASAIVDYVADYASRNGIAVTDSRLELLERWLSAWAYMLPDPRESSRSEVGASMSFEGQLGKKLELNRYGHMALVLDITGALAALGSETPKASLTFGGKIERERIPYWQR